jgi:serine/threonine protein kinase
LDGEQAVKDKRYNITLIDFGFARALKPSEIDTDRGLYNVVQNVAPDLPLENDNNKKLNAAVLASLEAPIDDGSQHGKKTRRGRMVDFDRSVSRRVVRDLSALGQRSYAAPEITKGVKKFQNNLSSAITGRHSSRRDADSDRPLAEFCSDYGMVADAFSLGATCRYMLTGVPPHIAVDEFIAMQKTPIAKMLKLSSKALKKIIGKKEGREKRYRSVEELPPAAGQLIHSLTHWDPSKRTTVRGAKMFLWIRSKGDDGGKELPNHTVRFLKCAFPEEMEEPS